MLIVRGLIGALIQTAVLAAALLLPAGTWQWPRALVFLGLYGVTTLGVILALTRFAPASLEARLQGILSKSQPRTDRAVTAVLVLLLGAWFLCIPVDVFHLRLLPPPPLFLSSVGLAVLVGGYGLIVLALFQNAYAAPIAKDQSYRGQVLVDTGVYARMRHPFYLGLILFLLGVALWLESLACCLASPLVIAVLILRIRVEERTLSRTLVGYSKYTTSVRYRLIPGIW